MQAQLARAGVIVGVAVVAALSVGYTTRHLEQSGGAPPPEVQVGPGVSAAAPEPSVPTEPRFPTEPRLAPPTEMGQGAPPPMPIPQAIPVTEGPIQPDNAPPLQESSPHRPHAAARAHPLPGLVPPDLPGIDPHDPSTWPKELRPPAAAGEPLGGGSPPPSEKVLSYFQKAKTQIDT